MANRRWSKDEDERIRLDYHNEGAERIAADIDRTARSVRVRAAYLGVVRSNPEAERDPTQAEIAERAAKIRAGWSDAERHRRLLGDTEYREDDDE